MEITYFEDRIDNLTVLSVCTNPGPGLDNFVASLRKFDYNFEIIGLGEPWGGWKWRTEQYIQALESKEDGLYVLCDSNDVLAIRPPKYLINQFHRYGDDTYVLIGSEQGCWNDHLKRYPMQRRRILREYSKYSQRYKYPNGGFIMGYRNSLLYVLKCNREAEDDQMGYTTLKMLYPGLFTVDVNTLCVGNIAATIPLFDRRIEEVNERSLWNIRADMDEVIAQNSITENSPAFLHFPGGNIDDYNEVGYLLLDDTFQRAMPKNKIKYVVKKPWAGSLRWIIH